MSLRSAWGGPQETVKLLSSLVFFPPASQFYLWFMAWPVTHPAFLDAFGSTRDLVWTREREGDSLTAWGFCTPANKGQARASWNTSM